jgi:hypothetical protein
MPAFTRSPPSDIAEAENWFHLNDPPTQELSCGCCDPRTAVKRHASLYNGCKSTLLLSAVTQITMESQSRTGSRNGMMWMKRLAAGPRCHGAKTRKAIAWHLSRVTLFL